MARSLGVVMTECRVRRKLSLDKVAIMMGANHYALSRWETGERIPTVPAIRRWAKSLNLTAEEVLDVSSSILYGPEHGGRDRLEPTGRPTWTT